jgi:hypothetical protein
MMMIGWMKYRIWKHSADIKRSVLVPKTFVHVFFGIAIVAGIANRVDVSAIAILFSIGFWIIYDYQKGEWKHWERENIKKRLIEKKVDL